MESKSAKRGREPERDLPPLSFVLSVSSHILSTKRLSSCCHRRMQISTYSLLVSKTFQERWDNSTTNDPSSLDATPVHDKEAEGKT